MAERLKLLLSDLDDTLVETKLEDYHMQLRALHPVDGPDSNYRQKVRKFMGGPGGEVIAGLYPDASPDERQDLLAEYRAIATADPEPARPIWGARKMLETLHRRHIRTALLTNRSSALDATLRTGGLSRRHFDHIYENVGERFGGKLVPAQQLMARYTLHASQVIMLGDSIDNDMLPFREGLPKDKHVTLAFVPKLILQESAARAQMAQAQKLGAHVFRTLEDCGEWIDARTLV